MSTDSPLPIAAFRDAIVQSVRSNQVTILTAETGAGKSTQVPQYLLEAGYEKIIVTQPRILAARSLSQRVREEWLGRYPDASPQIVGYRTAVERDDLESTAILYCTDGLQLVREVAGHGATAQQVLVLDEVHEWNQNMEVLVAWAKKRCQEEPAFKVLVMSATIDSDRLAAYFGAGAPIAVPGRIHPIAMRHGDQLVAEIERALYRAGHNLLVFLPGKAEIERVASSLAVTADSLGIPIIPLHSQLSAEEQQLAFASYPRGKVVLSTNIAQTSVTIDDIDLVIDSGLERHIEIQDGVEGLVIAQVSRADCLQRAGRAGRTKPGEYVLAPFEALPCLPIAQRRAYAVPEILRTHLDRTLLRLAAVGIAMEDLEFFHPPKPQEVAVARTTLVSLGAIAERGGVTPLGLRMERFPVQSRFARMLAEAGELSVATQARLVEIIAIQEVGGIVRGGARYSEWRQFTSQTGSDLLAQHDVWLAVRLAEPEALEDLGIVEKAMERVDDVRLRLLSELGLPGGEPIAVQPGEVPELTRCIIAGQADQAWLLGAGASAAPLGGGGLRERSGTSVVNKSRLVVGTPFDLEIPTQSGIENLVLVQDLTAVTPLQLVEAAPHLYQATPGNLHFDPLIGGLAQYWHLSYRGKTVRGNAVPVLERTLEHARIFAGEYAAWLHECLELDRVRQQKRLRRRLDPVPLQTVQDAVGRLAGDAVSLSQLSAQACVSLAKLASISAYHGELPVHRGGKRRKRKRH